MYFLSIGIERTMDILDWTLDDPYIRVATWCLSNSLFLMISFIYFKFSKDLVQNCWYL